MCACVCIHTFLNKLKPSFFRVPVPLHLLSYPERPPQEIRSLGNSPWVTVAHSPGCRVAVRGVSVHTEGLQCERPTCSRVLPTLGTSTHAEQRSQVLLIPPLGPAPEGLPPFGVGARMDSHEARRNHGAMEMFRMGLGCSCTIHCLSARKLIEL